MARLSFPTNSVISQRQSNLNRGNQFEVPPGFPEFTDTSTQLDASTQAFIQAQAQIMANQMFAAAEAAPTLTNGNIFNRFQSGDIVTDQKTFVTTGLFSGNEATMSIMQTSSLQTAASKDYYYEAWNGTTAASEPQFSVAYGHRKGSGSSADGTLNDSPSRAIYSQYRSLLLNPGDTTFTFGDGTSSDSIYAININRARIKDKLDPGNWQLHLTELTASANIQRIAATPKVISLIDDSGDAQQTLSNSGPVYNIVSGSITAGVYNASAPHYYGLVYPNMGMLILNDTPLLQSASFATNTNSDVAGDNAWKLFTSISGSMSRGNVFSARNEETVVSTHYFVRVKNGEYNFSNNPSFTTGSLGEFAQPTFIGDPKTYITTIGMYSALNELLAVAKLSQPIQKSFSNEALIKVKLDF